MRTRRLGFMVWVVVGLAVGWAGTGVAVGATPAEDCEAKKLQASGKKAQCLLSEEAKEAKGGTSNFAKCSDTFASAFAKAEAKAGAGVCPTEGDAAAIEAQVDACVADIAAALSGSPPPSPCQQFPATGQTTCSDTNGSPIGCANTGQDGDIRAGAALSYTDNPDGTITDNNTKLMWEKLCDEDPTPGATCPAEHDVDTTYTWADAFGKIAALNTSAFATYTDWRLPNVKELQSIIDYGTLSQPVVSSAFNTGCAASCTVLTCSCTLASYYWSSSTNVGTTTYAWIVGFDYGRAEIFPKTNSWYVRAVRGGS